MYTVCCLPPLKGWIPLSMHVHASRFDLARGEINPPMSVCNANRFRILKHNEARQHLQN